jgi:hypothetical protein
MLFGNVTKYLPDYTAKDSLHLARIRFFPVDQVNPHVGTDLCVAMTEAYDLERFWERTFMACFMVGCDFDRSQVKSRKTSVRIICVPARLEPKSPRHKPEVLHFQRT